MYDMHQEINEFFEEYVRLKSAQVEELDELRRRNISRLNRGLQKLGFNGPVQTPTQGGRAMKTMNQIPENNSDTDHDIDIAVIFKKEDLPEDPLKARQQVLAGVIEGGGNFSQEPEARTNAVTVWYKNGCHVDLAVHRVYTDIFGKEIIEHAGVEWCRRDPNEITNWFNTSVELLSPSGSEEYTVNSEQLRRIVQLLKYFSKSRSSWNLPGGLIISTLAEQNYVRDFYRDDRALYETMKKIYYQLCISPEVINPVDNSYKLTYKSEYVNQVIRFRHKLYEVTQWLSPLFLASCDRQKAAIAWNQVYKHSYWNNIVIEEAAARGKLIEAAISSGSLYTAETGKLSTTRPDGKSVHNQQHRFYGKE